MTVRNCRYWHEFALESFKNKAYTVFEVPSVVRLNPVDFADGSVL